MEMCLKKKKERKEEREWGRAGREEKEKKSIRMFVEDISFSSVNYCCLTT